MVSDCVTVLPKQFLILKFKNQLTSLAYWVFVAVFRQITDNEYIVPLLPKTHSLSLYRKLSPGSETFSIKHQIPNVENMVSIRPQLAISEREIEDRLVS